MKSGTAAYIIQGMYRVRLVSLLQKEPYVTTGVHFVESNEEDGIHMNSSNSNGIQNAEKYFVDMIDDLQQISDTDLDLVRGISDKLHKDLCCYMRLARIRILETKKKSPNFDATEETKKLITLTPSIYKNRPSVNSIEVNRVDQLRRYQLYSYAVGNLISTTPSTMHRLLSVGLVERLQGLASIMSGAADSLAKDMLASKTITDKEYRDLTLSEGKLLDDW